MTAMAAAAAVAIAVTHADCVVAYTPPTPTKTVLIRVVTAPMSSRLPLRGRPGTISSATSGGGGGGTFVSCCSDKMIVLSCESVSEVAPTTSLDLPVQCGKGPSPCNQEQLGATPADTDGIAGHPQKRFNPAFRRKRLGPAIRIFLPEADDGPSEARDSCSAVRASWVRSVRP